MSGKVLSYPSEILMQPLLSLIREGHTVPLVISGNSMSPFLVNGRDTVYLSSLSGSLKRGDMVLYRRDDGTYVLHRIYRVTKQAITMVGDAHTWLEAGIRQDQVLAIVVAVRRKGRLLKKTSFWWIFFRYIWLNLLLLRPFFRKLYSILTSIKRSIV